MTAAAAVASQREKGKAIAFCFIPSAMTEFIAYVFLYPNRVPLKGALEVLEPDDGKLPCPVLKSSTP